MDCPIAALDTCYAAGEFLNSIQHEFQTNWVGASPAIFFDTEANPWNLIYIGVFPDYDEVGAHCGITSASACALGFRIAMAEPRLVPSTSTTGINEGTTNYYYQAVYPDDCRAVEIHEYQHIIDRAFLQQHGSWFEEMIARLFAEHRWFKTALCPDIEYDFMYKVTDDIQTPLAEPPDLRIINSELPLDDFAAYYSEGDLCREAIIMQMNRDANEIGNPYLYTLFRLMRTEPIVTDEEIAAVLLEASGYDPDAQTFLQQSGCLLARSAKRLFEPEVPTVSNLLERRGAGGRLS